MDALELLYTMQDVSDAKLTSRMQRLLPWVHDLLSQGWERHGQARQPEMPAVPTG